MAISEEGNYNGLIAGIDFIQGRFQDSPQVIEVKITFNVENVGQDVTYLSLDQYTYGTKNNSHLTRQQMTLNTLKMLGCDDLSQIQNVLIKQPISIYSKKNDSGYINHYVSQPKGTVLSAQDVMSQLFGSPAPAQQAPQQAQAQAPAKPAFATAPAQASAPTPSTAFDTQNF